MQYARITNGAVETILDLDSEYVETLAPNKRSQLLPFVIDEKPEAAQTQAVDFAGYVIEAERVRQTWTLRQKTADELRVVASPRQIRQALNAAGLRQQVEAGVAAADQDTRDWWEFSTAVESDHPAVLAMCTALGISDEQRAQVFGLAASL